MHHGHLFPGGFFPSGFSGGLSGGFSGGRESFL
jgi:hypothetical protein